MSDDGTYSCVIDRCVECGSELKMVADAAFIWECTDCKRAYWPKDDGWYTHGEGGQPRSVRTGTDQ